VALDKAQLKKKISSMRQALNVNLERRLQHAKDPELFLDSEAELHNAVKSL